MDRLQVSNPGSTAPPHHIAKQLSMSSLTAMLEGSMTKTKDIEHVRFSNITSLCVFM